MAISKVIYSGTTLIDLTSDNVEASALLDGYTAHGPDGEVVAGTCTFDADTRDATATAAEILASKTAYKNGSKLTGTMTNNGAVSGTITTKSGAYTVPKGYHDGSGKVQISSAEQAKLVPDNIRDGVTILGVAGKMSGTEGAVPQAKTVTPTTSEQTILPDEGYNFLSQVTVAAIPYEESTNSAGGKTVSIG